MTREKQIQILQADRCTRKEAERYLENRVTIFTAQDFEANFDNYMKEWFGTWDEEEIQAHRKMIEQKIPLTDWSIVDFEGNTYYIQYCN